MAPQFQRPDFLTQQKTKEEALAGPIGQAIQTLPQQWQAYKLQKEKMALDYQRLQEEKNRQYYAPSYSPEGQVSFTPYPTGGRPGPGAPAPTTLFNPQGEKIGAVSGKATVLKPPPGEEDLRKREDAKNRVSKQLETLASYYQDLSSAGAAVDVEKGVLSNVKSRLGASAVGQSVGKAAGTKEQSIRNKIQQIQPLLLQEIRKATEMGARGLDSEKELEFYLKAATDPGLDIQSNLSAIRVLDEAYGLGIGIKMDSPGGALPEVGGQFQGGKVLSIKKVE